MSQENPMLDPQGKSDKKEDFTPEQLEAMRVMEQAFQRDPEFAAKLKENRDRGGRAPEEKLN